MTKYILIYGNPVDGMSFEGPFEDFEDAEDHTLHHDGDWWIANLIEPEKHRTIPADLTESERVWLSTASSHKQWAERFDAIMVDRDAK